MIYLLVTIAWYTIAIFFEEEVDKFGKGRSTHKMDVVVKYGEVHGILQTYIGYSLRISLFLKTFFPSILYNTILMSFCGFNCMY